MTTSTAAATVTSLTMSITYSRPADGWPTMTITGVPVDVDDVFVTVTATPIGSARDAVRCDVQAVAVHGTARGQKVTWNTELQALPAFIGELTGQAQDAAGDAIGAVL